MNDPLNPDNSTSGFNLNLLLLLLLPLLLLPQLRIVLGGDFVSFKTLANGWLEVRIVYTQSCAGLYEYVVCSICTRTFFWGISIFKFFGRKK